MSFSIGKNIKFNIFGASHDICVGGMIDGLPAGYEIDFDRINEELTRRRPSKKGETKRIETDEFLFLSGLENGKTTEAPFVFGIKNKDINQADYNEIKEIFRPGHADYSKFKKYDGHAFSTGGGVFSGRMTAPIVVVGAIIKDLLKEKGIEVTSSVVFGESGTGSKIKVSIKGILPGIGEPFFDSLESNISKGIFSIPAVKGINFGEIEELYNKNIKDIYLCYELKDGEPKLDHNYWGGIDGGISNGEKIYFYVLLKPIQTHDFMIETLDKELNKREIKMSGRHDKNISQRVQVVLEAITAFQIYDLMLEV